MIKSGLSIHCHHNTLLDYCYNFEKRVKAIKDTKPQNEQEIRLRLFKLLPQKAVDELPIRLLKAYAEWDKAYAEWDKADAEWDKADAEWVKADAEWVKANAEWVKANAEWVKADRDIWHAKWCGCKEWNGMEIIFPNQRTPKRYN